MGLERVMRGVLACGCAVCLGLEVLHEGHHEHSHREYHGFVGLDVRHEIAGARTTDTPFVDTSQVMDAANQAALRGRRKWSPAYSTDFDQTQALWAPAVSTSSS
jgi:hypothetical protein